MASAQSLLQTSTQRPCTDTKPVSAYLTYKGLLSPAIAAVLCIPLLPVMGILYLLVRLTSRGPGFYSQVRLGRDGQRYTIYKLRTMRVDAEAGTGPTWATKNDPRITPIGRFLRRYHLDELPQIVNVIMGEMCFVGPRPERPEIAIALAKEIPHYWDRLLVKPGITGMAQIHLPPDTSLDSVRRKQSYDVTYIRNGSFILDLRVVLATMFKVLPFANTLPQQIGHCREFLCTASGIFESTDAPNRAMVVVEK